MIKFTKIMITSRFDKKDMSVTNIILRIKNIRTFDGLILS
jgi:hypothetical protein